MTKGRAETLLFKKYFEIEDLKTEEIEGKYSVHKVIYAMMKKVEFHQHFLRKYIYNAYYIKQYQPTKAIFVIFTNNLGVTYVSDYEFKKEH